LAEGQILSHATGLDGVNATCLQNLTELGELVVVVQLGAVSEATGPGKDGGDGVGGGGLALLVLAVVTSDRSVCGLGFNGLAIRAHEDGGHETKGAVTLSDDIGLNVTIVILAGPDESTLRLDGEGDHVIDQTVLVPETGGFELGLVLLLVDLSEDVLESAIVLLQDGVLGGEVAGHLDLKGVLQGRMSETLNGGVCVVHANQNTAAILELEDLHFFGGAAVFGGEFHGELTVTGDDEIGGFVLITVSVTTDDDGLFPAGHKLGDVVDDDGGTEDHTIKNVTDGAVGGSPHLLEVELLNASFIRGDGRALDADVVLLDGVSAIDGNLIVGLITLLDGEIVILDVNVDVAKDELVLDPRPENAGHLIAVHLDDLLVDLDLLETAAIGVTGHLEK